MAAAWLRAAKGYLAIQPLHGSKLCALETYYVCVQVTQSEIYELKLHTVPWFASSRRDQCGFTVIHDPSVQSAQPSPAIITTN